jgi:hypothetical protein
MKPLALALVIGLVGSVGAASTGDKKDQGPSKEDIQKGEAQVKEFLARIKGESGTILYLGNDQLHENFPAHRFYAVRYRVYPVAMQRPEGMEPSNVFVVPKNGKAEHLKDVKALEAFFKANLGQVKERSGPVALAMEAWLSLSPELYQDGFYKFDNRGAYSLGGSPITARGKAIVMAGGNGEIDVTMTFGTDGKLVRVDETAKIKRGPRPRCHATKLLDADPIVRQICEEDLLYMGRPALDYLREQRALASPALRQAIDRVIERIQREDQ